MTESVFAECGVCNECMRRYRALGMSCMCVRVRCYMDMKVCVVLVCKCRQCAYVRG